MPGGLGMYSGISTRSATVLTERVRLTHVLAHAVKECVWGTAVTPEAEKHVGAAGIRSLDVRGCQQLGVSAR
eukprot:COSAG03_NODE_576_length_6891_cov_135.585395_6_plen_72_part_00